MVTHNLNSASCGNRIPYLCNGAIRGGLNLDVLGTADKDRHDRLATFLEEMGW